MIHHRSIGLLFIVTLMMIVGSWVTPGTSEADQFQPSVAQALEDFQAQQDVRGFVAADDGASVRLMWGTLSEPSTRSSLDVARSFLEDRGSLIPAAHEGRDLVLSRSIDGHDLSIVRFQQQIDGVPVIGAHAVIAVDSAGQVRLVAQTIEGTIDEPERHLVTAIEAAQIVSSTASVPLPNVQPREEYARAVFVRTPEGLVPAYDVYFGRVIPLLSNWHVFIDAVTGEELGRVNRIYADRTALIWPENPFQSDFETVDLEMIDLEDLSCNADDALPPSETNDVARACTSRVSVRNCVDFNETTTVNLPGYGEIAVHTCSEYHMATPNDAPDGSEKPDDLIENDFFFTDARPEPDYDYFSDDEYGEDLFAEIHMLYHIERAFSYFGAFDPEVFSELSGGQLVASVNWRLPFDLDELESSGSLTTAFAEALDPYGMLYPYNNAFFMPGGDMFGALDRSFDSIVFFQGAERDPAYDSDVIYHEFTHAVIDTVVGGTMGLSEYRRDEQGISRQSFAMNEAYADFFAAAMNGNSVIGEYALSHSGSAPRDIDSQSYPVGAYFPYQMKNEEHADSAYYSQALWEIHSEFGDSIDIDRAIFLGLASLLPDADFHDGAAATVAMIESLYGSEVASRAREIFAVHNYDGLTRPDRVTHLDEHHHHDTLIIDGRDQIVGMSLTPFVPAPLQFRIEVEQGEQETRALVIRYELAENVRIEDLLTGNSSPPQLGMLVRQGDEPIRFPTTGAIAADADFFVFSDMADVNQGVEGATLGPRQIVFSVPEGESLTPGTYRVQLVNLSSGGAKLTNIYAETMAEPPVPADDPEDDPEYDPWDFSNPTHDVGMGDDSSIRLFDCNCSASGSTSDSSFVSTLRSLLWLF